MTQLHFTKLTTETITDFYHIDRSEIVDGLYYYRDGALVYEEKRFVDDGFSADEYADILARQKKILALGGSVVGGYDGDQLVGIVSVENNLRGSQKNYVKMDILHISAAYRKHGIASELMRRASDIARSFGATKLYISATPSKNTIDFYMRKGCRLTEELDDELFAMEPEDIHLELDL